MKKRKRKRRTPGEGRGPVAILPQIGDNHSYLTLFTEAGNGNGLVQKKEAKNKKNAKGKGPHLIN